MYSILLHLLGADYMEETMAVDALVQEFCYHYAL